MNQASDWTVYRTRFLVRARQLTDALQFTDALGRHQSGQPGDYLVEIFDGLLSITPRKFFEDIYVPLDSAATSASPPFGHPVLNQSAPAAPDRLSPAAVHSRGSPLPDTRGLVVPRAPDTPVRPALIA